MTTMNEIDLEQKQRGSDEQAVILTALASAAARPKGAFLEIGTWCGDSAILLGKVAQKSKSRLFCVDWWKGNPGTPLEAIAAKKDIFSIFWKRVQSEGLEDVIVPIRARSDEAAALLKDKVFDFIFIDGGHNYNTVLSDIRHYAPLVRKPGGILCGDDCQGRIEDFSRKFLEEGKNFDFHLSTHCGVVLAVGESFKDYSIDYSLWSVRAAEDGWEPTQMTFPGITNKRQLPASPVGITTGYLLFRFGEFIYAAPRNITDFDVTEETFRNHPEVKRAKTIEEIQDLTGEEIYDNNVPILMDTYRGHNLIRYKNIFYAVSQDIGNLDLSMKENRRHPEVLSAKNRITLERLIGKKAWQPMPRLLEQYKDFNIIEYKDKIYAMSQHAGPLNLESKEDARKLPGFSKKGLCVIENSVSEVKNRVDKLTMKPPRHQWI